MLKIQLHVTLDLPEEGVRAWETEYGLEGRSSVRADVRRYLLSLLHDCHGAELTGWTVRD